MPEEKNGAAPIRSKEELALEMMKFIAITTGYGKAGATGPGFSPKAPKGPEEHAEALLQLYKRCHGVIDSDS
jgi:hypothetical protein